MMAGVSKSVAAVNVYRRACAIGILDSMCACAPCARRNSSGKWWRSDLRDSGIVAVATAAALNNARGWPGAVLL